MNREVPRRPSTRMDNRRGFRKTTMNKVQDTANAVSMEAINDVLNERVRQLRKFGIQDHPIADWFLILGEEVGEAHREACEHVFRLRFPEHYPEDPERLKRLRKELVEVAAVAVAMVESLDRNELRAALAGVP